MSNPAGYLITFTTYGARLHGDARGSYERSRSGDVTRYVAPDPRRERHEQLLSDQPVVLRPEARGIVADTVAEVCSHRDWKLHAVNVRTNHVHAVLSGDARPEIMMNTLIDR